MVPPRQRISRNKKFINKYHPYLLQPQSKGPTSMKMKNMTHFVDFAEYCDPVSAKLGATGK